MCSPSLCSAHRAACPGFHMHQHHLLEIRYTCEEAVPLHDHVLDMRRRICSPPIGDVPHLAHRERRLRRPVVPAPVQQPDCLEAIVQVMSAHAYVSTMH